MTSFDLTVAEIIEEMVSSVQTKQTIERILEETKITEETPSDDRDIHGRWERDVVSNLTFDDVSRRVRSKLSVEERTREVRMIKFNPMIFTINYVTTSTGEVYLPTHVKNMRACYYGPFYVGRYVWQDSLMAEKDNVRKAERILHLRAKVLSLDVFSHRGLRSLMKKEVEKFYEAEQPPIQVKRLVARALLAEYNLDIHEHKVRHAWCFACRLKYEFYLMSGIDADKMKKAKQHELLAVPTDYEVRQLRKKAPEVIDLIAAERQEKMRSMGLRMSRIEARKAIGAPLKRTTKSPLSLSSGTKGPQPISRPAKRQKKSKGSLKKSSGSLKITLNKAKKKVETVIAEGSDPGSYETVEAAQYEREAARYEKNAMLNELTLDLTELCKGQLQLQDILRMFKEKDTAGDFSLEIQMMTRELESALSKLLRIQEKVRSARSPQE